MFCRRLYLEAGYRCSAHSLGKVPADTINSHQQVSKRAFGGGGGNLPNIQPLSHRRKMPSGAEMSCPCQALAYVVVKVKVAQSCLTLRPHGLYSPRNSPGQNTGVGSLSLLQRIFPTQESNQGLWHCRLILYQLSYQGSPYM